SGQKQAQAPESTVSVPADAQGVAANTQKIAWRLSLPEALAEAKGRKTLIVVDAYADWCHWCTKMDEDTFTNAEVQHRMKDFVPVRINTDHDPEFAQRYGVSGLPTTLVLDATGKVKLSQSGYLPPQDYLQLLAQAAKMRAD
ncbi:MAG TPA: thioredoxin fold domain-containing protein, partial [Armatimonadota bacterium]